MTLAFVTFVACSSGSDTSVGGSAPAPSVEPSSPSVAPTASEPPSPEPEDAWVLTYLDRTRLKTVEVPSGKVETLGSVASQDVWAIPGSDRFLVVADRGGGEDFAAAPFLSVVDPATGGEETIGDGFGPLVHPSGSMIAFLRSAGERVCEGEACFGGVEVMVTGLASPPDVLLEAGPWHLLGWSGDDLLVSGGARPGTFLASPDGELTRLPASPSEVWDASPDGDHLILVEGDGTRVLDLGSGDSTSLELAGPLADGGWSTEGDLLAVELGGRGSKLVDVSVEEGAVETVGGSRGAMGPVLWSEDSAAFSYVRARGAGLEAIVCAEEGGCSTALSWKEGIVPLSLTSSDG